MPIDPVLDYPEKREGIKQFLIDNLGISDWSIVQGKANIQRDLILKNAYGKYDVTAELKTRWPSDSGFIYPDIAVEITQYQRECDILDSLIYEDRDFDEILNILPNFSTGWYVKSTAKIIIYVTADHIDIITKKGLKEYVRKHRVELITKRKKSNITTGAYNIIVPYDKTYMKRFTGTEKYTKNIFN